MRTQRNRLGVLLSAALLACGGPQGSKDGNGNVVDDARRQTLEIDTTETGLRFTLASSKQCRMATGEIVPCQQIPIEAAELGLIVKSDGEPVELRLGATGAFGEVEVSWSTLASQIPDSATSADVFVQTRGVVVGQVDLAPARKALADRVWKETQDATSSGPVGDYMARFPDIRAREAQQRFAELRIPEIKEEIRARLASGNVAYAASLVAEWQDLSPLPDPARDEVVQQIKAAQVRYTLDAEGKKVDAAIARALAEEQPARDLLFAEASLEKIGRVAPDSDDYKRRLTSYQNARATIIARLIAKSREHLAKQQEAEAYVLLGELRKIDPHNQTLKTLDAELRRRWKPGTP